MAGASLGPTRPSKEGKRKEFDAAFLEAVDGGLSQVLGEAAAGTILLHMERHRGLEREEVLHNVEEFSSCLTELLGSDAAQLLERVMIKILCSRLQLDSDDNPNMEFKFSEHVQRLRERFEG